MAQGLINLITTINETTFQSKPSRYYDENNPFSIAGGVISNTCGSLKIILQYKNNIFKKKPLYLRQYIKIKLLMFIFNKRGNLVPAEIISTDWQNFYNYFVDVTNDKQRQVIGKQLFTFLLEIYEIINEPFEIWIDGSFITQKISPNDIDILIHLPNDIFTMYKSTISPLIEQSKYMTNGLIDAYITIQYPDNHQYFPLYEADLNEWKHIYGKTRATPSGVRFPKGILTLKFSRNDSNN